MFIQYNYTNYSTYTQIFFAFHSSKKTEHKERMKTSIHKNAVLKEDFSSRQSVKGETLVEAISAGKNTFSLCTNAYYLQVNSKRCFRVP